MSYAPSPKASSVAARKRVAEPSVAPSRKMIFVAPRLDLRLPAIDLPATFGSADDFKTAGRPAPVTEPTGQDDGSDRAHFAAEVDKPASLAPGNRPPRYPDVLRAAGVEGRVVATFVVGADGRVEVESIRLSESANGLFEEAVRVALVRMRFQPAEIAGKKIRQLVAMPFVFALER